MKRFLIPVIIFLCGVAQVRGVIVMNPNNGHHYDDVRSAMNWDAANAAATASSYNGVTGHLATITSASENLFITDAFGAATIDMLWIGGYQPAGSPEPAGGWSWVTGESFVCDNWFPPFEPNNLGDQDRIMFAHLVLDDGRAWDDFIGGNNGAGYVVEYDTPLPASVPKPSSVALLLAGALVFGYRRLRKNADTCNMRCTGRFALSNRTALLRSSILSLVLVCNSSTSATAGVITFGTGSNQFTMEFVEIGNPGNPDDTTGDPNPAGSVAYTYQMGKYEVSEAMIDAYNAEFGTANSLVITKVTRGSPEKPATNVSWNEAARFVNWLNTSTGGSAAYNFTTGGVNDNITPWTVSDTLDYDASNPYRSIRATYVLPSMDEWYKAAYYDPANNVYYDYPTGSNSAPTAVASGTTAGTAVYGQVLGPIADITLAGGLSPYGIMAMGGNVYELEETAFSLDNSSGASSRGLRGGYNLGSDNIIKSSARTFRDPEFEATNFGFRVASLSVAGGASVPEPGSMALLLAGALVFGVRRIRSRRARKQLCRLGIAGAVLLCAGSVNAGVIVGPGTVSGGQIYNWTNGSVSTGYQFTLADSFDSDDLITITATGFVDFFAGGGADHNAAGIWLEDSPPSVSTGDYIVRTDAVSGRTLINGAVTIWNSSLGAWSLFEPTADVGAGSSSPPTSISQTRVLSDVFTAAGFTGLNAGDSFRLLALDSNTVNSGSWTLTLEFTEVSAVPEPSSVALLLGGALVFGVRRFRSRRLRQQLCQLGIVGAVFFCAGSVNAGVITLDTDGYLIEFTTTAGQKIRFHDSIGRAGTSFNQTLAAGIDLKDAGTAPWWGNVATAQTYRNELYDTFYSDYDSSAGWPAQLAHYMFAHEDNNGTIKSLSFSTRGISFNPLNFIQSTGPDDTTSAYRLFYAYVDQGGSIVPEPSSVALLLGGALVFGVRRFRSRRVRQQLCQLGIAGAVLLCAGSVTAGVIVYDVNQNSGLTGFNTAAGSPGVLVDFDSIAAGTDIGGTTISGMTFNAVGAPLIVVDGNSTTTPGGFSGVSNASTNKLYPTSGLNVLSPGGATLGPGFNSAVENDDLGLVFDVPVLAFGFDLLSQSQDGGSGVSVSVYNQSNTLLYSAQIPISSISGAGSPGGADFWGVMATGSDLIGQILIDESDQNASYPDANIGFDTFRVAAAPAAVPEPSSVFLLAGGLSLLMLTRWKRARNVAVAVTLVCCVVPTASAGVIYDAVADFTTVSNPSGVWSYLYSDDTVRDGSYSLFPEVAPLVSGPGVGSSVWHADAGATTAQRPWAGINTTVTGSGTWQVGELALHPGQSGGGFGDGLAILTWTSPLTGTVDVNYSLAMGLAGNVTWFFDKNDSNSTLDSGSLSGASGTDSISLSSVSVTTGDRLSLILNTNGSVGADLVRLTNATIEAAAVPEPSSTACLVLMGVCWMRRCRRQRVTRQSIAAEGSGLSSKQSETETE